MILDYALLTRLPLLQGIGSTELLGWEEALRLDFDELPAGGPELIRQGDTCSALLWLAEGELRREHRSADGLYTTRSTLKAPAAIEPDRLFGLTPAYEHTYWAQTDIRMLSLRKSQMGSHLLRSEVFRLNLLNCLSACAQRRAAALQPCIQDNAEGRLKHFLATLFPDCEGEAELFVRMKDLARYIGETRLTVSRLLRRWAAEGSIIPGREHFTVRNLKTLLTTQETPARHA